MMYRIDSPFSAFDVRAKTKARDVAKTRASRNEDASQDESAVQTETV